MPAADPPPTPPPPDVPRHVADLSDVQRCADSKKDNLMDRTDANTQSWIAFRFQFYMALLLNGASYPAPPCSSPPGIRI